MLYRLDAFRQDVGYAVRPLLRSPAHALLVAATFALGIGANATMFGIVDRLLLRPQPHVRAPEELFRVERDFRLRSEDRTGTVLSYPVYAALRESVPGFSAVAMYTAAKPVSLGVGAEARPVQAMLVSGSYFGTLGTRMRLGRPLLPQDDRDPMGAPAVVIGHGLWKRGFGARPGVLGAEIMLGSRRYAVVGVAPEGFTGIDGRPVDVWLPVAAAEGLRSGGAEWATNRGSSWLEVVARLAPGASPRVAAAQAGAVMRSPELASTGGEDTTTAATLLSVLPARQPSLTPEKRVAVLLGGVSVLVLLIACANVANLLLARSLGRRREIAVRLALGIGRARLVRQLLLETLAMAVAGGVLALAIVRWGSVVVQKLILSDHAWPDSPLDARVLAFTTAATLGVGALAALVPALQASAPDLSRTLREGAPGSGGARSRTRAALLLAQMALAVVLLVGTGLFVRSLQKVGAVSLGLDVDRLLVGTIDLRSVGLDSASSEAYFVEAAARVRRLPGVASAVVAEAPPFGGWSMGTTIRRPGRDSLPALDQDSYRHAVQTGYFATVGTRILRGREFSPSDSDPGAEPVAVVNERAARALWPDADPLGDCVRIGEAASPCARVVGIAEDTHRGRVTGEEEILQLYEPFGRPEIGPKAYVLLVRPAGPSPDRLVEPVRRTMQTVAGALPFADVRPMPDALRYELRPWRLGAMLFGAFAAVAVLLSALGLYGVVAHSVAQRKHEMGVRAAVGAQSLDIVRMVVARSLRVAAAGVALGATIALVAGRAVQPLLYEESPRDPLVFAAVISLLLLVATLASLVPALRATRTDPLNAMRGD